MSSARAPQVAQEVEVYISGGQCRVCFASTPHSVGLKCFLVPTIPCWRRLIMSGFSRSEAGHRRHLKSSAQQYLAYCNPDQHVAVCRARVPGRDWLPLNDSAVLFAALADNSALQA